MNKEMRSSAFIQKPTVRTVGMLLLLLLCLAQGARAQIEYIDRSWNGSQVVSETKSVSDYVTFLNSSTLNPGEQGDQYWVAPPGETTVTGTITIHGEVHIILCDGAVLKCQDAIIVEKRNNDAKLHIHCQSYGDKMGQLIVTTSTVTNAGIGGSMGYDVGDIFIIGGNISSTGAKRGAGIGSGGGEFVDNEWKAGNAGTLRVYGGKVTATGGQYAAGIGAGAGIYHGDKKKEYIGSAGSFYLYDGDVTATGGEYAAGVGSAPTYHWFYAIKTTMKSADGANVNVYGGTLTARGGHRAAGIGSGQSCSTEAEHYPTGGSLTVRGGTVKAFGGDYGAGIGGGTNCNGGDVTVNGGNVFAKGGEDAAGIGGGEDGNGGRLTVNGGTVIAEGTGDGAGIGGGGKTSGGRKHTYQRRKPFTNYEYEDVNTGEPDSYGAIVTIKGGTVIGIAGGDCNSREDKGGSAIGGGKGVADKNGYWVEKVYNATSLTIPAGHSVWGGDQENDANGVNIGTADRVYACRWRNYVMISPCGHADHSYTFVDEDYHTASCLFCEKTEQERHNMDNAERTCVCGKKFDLATDVYSINIYQAKDATSGAYDNGLLLRVVKGQSFRIPTCDAPDGLVFMDWLQDPSSAPSDYEMRDGETVNLMPAGTTLTPTADVNLYARYRYQYDDVWTWAEDANGNPTATVNITWADGTSGPQGLTADIYKSHDDPAEGERVGRYTYNATATYEKGPGINYQFTDQLNKPSLIIADDSDNSELLAAYDSTGIASVTLSRPFHHNNSWHTLCLPFDVTSLEGTPLEGATVKTLSSSSLTNGMLNINFSDNLTAVEAGKPYIVKWTDEELSYNCGEANDGIGSDDADNLFDGDTDSKWCFRTTVNSESYCEFSTNRPVYVNAYTLTTGGDTQSYQNRNPKKWKLEAKLASYGEWEEIDSRDAGADDSDALPTTNGTAKRYTLSTPGAYRYFRLVVEEANGTESYGGNNVWVIQLSELSLEENSTWPNLVFSNVRINAATTNQETDYVDFIGTYSPVGIYTDDKTNLYIGQDYALHYPTSSDFQVNACRAYFHLNQGLTAGEQTSSHGVSFRGFNLNFDNDAATGIETTDFTKSTNSGNEWYAIDGRKLNGKPTAKGIYINNGRKFIIK